VLQTAFPDAFQGADPRYHFVPVPSFASSAPGEEYQLWRTPENLATVVRYVNISFLGVGTVGTNSISLYGLYPFGIDAVKGYGGELTAACPVSFATTANCRITWATDLRATYSNRNLDWGVTVQVPIPITYLPPSSVISINVTNLGGGDGAQAIDFGQLVLEEMPPGAIGAGGGGQGRLADVYLLPQAF
jgi:hypothetical protein